MGEKIEICADEAWTHGSNPPNRYWCFLGGLRGTAAESDLLETKLREVLGRAGHAVEVKWSGTTPVTLLLYRSLVDEFFDQVCATGLAYRQIFLDRSFVHVGAPNEPVRQPLDVQYLIYYQYNKHQFGLGHLPAATQDNPHEILLRLDNHSSQKHKVKLDQFVQGLPGQLARRDLQFRTTYVNSKKFRRLQICDLVMGAAGWYGNQQYKRREIGQRGMNARQRSKFELSKYIYNRIRSIDAEERNSKAFNWFESTGGTGNPQDSLTSSVRIWKFKPKDHKIDYGFKNKNLDSQGRYQGPIWNP